MAYRYLIVGGGMTGDAAAKGIREHDPDGSIGLVGDEPHPPYARPPLSKALWKGDDEDSIWRGTDELGVDLRLGRRIVALDLDAHTRDRRPRRDVRVRAAAARDRRPPAARCRSAPTTSSTSGRSTTTGACARSPASGGTRFVVIGGGFIGSEIAAALAMNGSQVTMVFPEAGIGARLFPPELARFVTDYYRDAAASRSCRARRSTASRRATATSPSTTERRAHARGGRRRRRARHRARRPSSPRPPASTVDNGIVVDDHGRVGGRDDVFAAGDVARFPRRALGTSVARRARGPREEPRPAGRREHGRRRRAVRPPAVLLLRPLRPRLRGGRRGRLAARRPSRRGPSRTARAIVAYVDEQGRPRGFLLWDVWGKVDDATRADPRRRAGRRGEAEGVTGLEHQARLSV